ncbi:insecticidal toxin complex protein TccC [Pseudomonas sp. JAI111]|uniref:RHS repeat-associated core domain-containing protein n=1 Tax=Pseudomonas sp. JAI111 TaxID=2735913 RepID=UPI00216757F7|nr:RHS repeat-associated core domain-containing protein [Pseudomonas sp. JAI111]MCS3836244.1 insecticidal toxin complex protein TccC [Pseudomonas sp. JAI111]
MHTRTPRLSVIDPRELTVRTVDYHRETALAPLDKRVTYQVYDSSGRKTDLFDPRLFKLLETEPTISANIKTVFSLSGKELLTASVDAGDRLHLPGPAGQNCDSWDSKFTHTHVEYDDLIRPVKESVRIFGESERVNAYFSYAGNDSAFVERNQCGQLIRHDDSAGTMMFSAFSLKGELLECTRKFLDKMGAPDWPHREADRDLLHEKGDGATTCYRHNAVSQLLCQTDAEHNTQTFEYTVDAQVAGIKVQIGVDGQEKDLLVDIRYNAFNKVERQTFANGLVCSAMHSSVDGRLEELKAQFPGKPLLQHLIYCYDPVGNILSIEDKALPVRYFRNQRIEPVRTFHYDTLYQLIYATGWQVVGGRVGPYLPEFQSPTDPGQLENYTETFGYDCSGNLITQIHCAALGSRTQRMKVSKYSNRALVQKSNGELPTEAEIAAGYDPNGNKRLLLPGQDLFWDERNLLQRVEQVVRPGMRNDAENYVYDYVGQRQRKIRTNLVGRLVRSHEVRYLRGLEIRTDNEEELHVINVHSELCNVRVQHRMDRRQKVNTISYRYTLTDQIGSCCLEMDDGGEVISEEVFYSYGCTAWWAGSDIVKANDKTSRYSGKELDATGLCYYGFRYYVPWWNRWLSPDPAGVVDGLNLYCMAGNSPVTFFDKAGLNNTNVNAGGKDDYGTLVSAFEEGDILFGLREPRDLALKALEKAGVKEFSRLPLWKEGIPRLLWEKKRNVLKQNDLTDAAFGPTVTAGVYNSDEQIKAELVDAERGVAYKEFAMTNRYFQKDEKGVGNFFEVNVPMWRRSSKAGLEFQIFERDKKVLFAIDNLIDTLDDIVSKKPGAGTSVTASEIRYVYRRKDTPEVKNNVKFFVAGRELSQAEFFNHPAWKNYHPRKTYSKVVVPRRSQASRH